jgi:hypothetical protein
MDVLHPIYNSKYTVMQTLTKKIAGLGLALILFCAFTSPGGDSYEVYIGKERILQYFVHGKKSVPVIKLNDKQSDQQMSVTYSHCGTIGKDRAITIRNEKTNVEKKWKFADMGTVASLTGSGKAMNLSVADIIQLKKKNGNNKLTLYYASRELPEGKVLATIE